jgi:DNA-binding IclR family transcriptional regulator
MADGAEGVQTLERAVRVLRLIGKSDRTGLRLVDIQRSADLTRPTAHRMMSALVRLGLAVRDSESRTYHLGPELAVLGWRAPDPRFDFFELAQSELIDLALETEDTAFLVVRSGYDVVCVEQKLGRYPIKAVAAEVGTRWPLGLGAGSIAILASLTPEEQDDVFDANREKLAKYPGWSEDQCRKELRPACARGYAISQETVITNIVGIAAPVHQNSRPIAALCVAGIRDRMTETRLPQLALELKRLRRSLEAKLARMPGRR